MLTEQEMLQELKNYILKHCGIIDRNTKEILKHGTFKDKIHLGLNKIKAQHQEFTAYKIGELFDQAMIELIENDIIVIIKCNYFDYYCKYN